MNYNNDVVVTKSKQVQKHGLYEKKKKKKNELDDNPLPILFSFCDTDADMGTYAVYWSVIVLTGIN